jgi:hypothetical protein
MNRLSIVLCVFIIKSYYIVIESHGRLMDPPGRGSMWRFGFDVPPNYDDMSNYCGGIDVQWGKNHGKCGICGDGYDDNPQEHEPGGKYATGIIGKTYVEGTRIQVVVEITANHLGYFEFRLCVNDEPMKKVAHECFDKNLLEVLNNEKQETNPLGTDNRSFKYFVPNTRNDNYTVELKLPDGVTCKQCVMQWRYHAGNNYGKSFSGSTCLGCDEKQEEFYNCADISIEIDRNKPESSNDSLTNTTLSLPISGVTIKRNFFYLRLFTFVCFMFYL